ncbi:hypothetical protein LZP69_08365 [Shewanella sp. AS1]|uniref:hypothetical protein n=1 Tax=Shewanella sp. AS1 TaxID=2907626 RepID=UPI001F199660|nr:hypothetical protein [Shewanella sp. AS1]MCE9679186.1 hypothetical protein [Shewanella sp. AS1]
MKYKFLAVCISAAIVVGCNDHKDKDKDVVTPPPPPPSSLAVQAFDGAVWGMDAEAVCDGGDPIELGMTDFEGFVYDETIEDPSNCSFTFLPTENAIDVSNGKDMSDVTYKVPVGLVTADTEKVTASPISTLIADTLGDQAYNEATAVEVLNALGLTDLTTVSGISIEEFLLDVEGSMATIKEEGNAELFSQIAATNVVLSDTLVANPGIDPTQLAKAAGNLTATVLESYPEYPMNTSGEEIVIDVKETSKNIDDLTDPNYDPATPPATVVVPAPQPVNPPEEPEDPTQPPTGGTGGTGGAGGGGTGG